jgi:hypothetical protein
MTISGEKIERLYASLFWFASKVILTIDLVNNDGWYWITAVRDRRLRLPKSGQSHASTRSQLLGKAPLFLTLHAAFHPPQAEPSTNELKDVHNGICS